MAFPLLWLLAGGAGLALFTAGKQHKGKIVTPQNPRELAPPPPDIDKLDEFNGDSGTVWNVETVIPRGQSEDGTTAKIIVWDMRMQPILSYTDRLQNGKRYRHVETAWGPKGQVEQAKADFGMPDPGWNEQHVT